MQDPIIGEVLSGTYRIERLLGIGSMGTVYEASHLRLPRRFAVKILAVVHSPEQRSVARFQQEAQVTSALGHPNIVEVVDFNFTEDGRPFIVMELLSGEDLQTRLEREGRLPPDQAEAVLSQVASALTATHEMGVVHRDLKPQNIFISQGRDGQELVKVVDFGISKVLGQGGDLTTADRVVGTPHYMSPEQALGKKELVDGRTDVFAMGVILYAMLSGEVPFKGEAIPSVLYNIVHGERPSLLALCPELPVAVEQVVVRALAIDPAARQETLEGLHQEFVRAQREGIGPQASPDAGETALVQPVAPDGADWPRGEAATTSVMPSAEPWPLRKILPLALAGGLALVLVAGVIAYLASLPPSSPHGGAGSRVAMSAPAMSPDRGAPDLPPPPDLMPPDLPRPDQLTPDSAALAPRNTPPGRRRPRRAAVRSAFLTVNARFRGKAYWAHVRLDGRRLGETPVHRIKLPPGKHKVIVGRPGFRTDSVTTTLRRGEHRTVTINLKRKP